MRETDASCFLDGHYEACRIQRGSWGLCPDAWGGLVGKLLSLSTERKTVMADMHTEWLWVSSQMQKWDHSGMAVVISYWEAGEVMNIWCGNEGVANEKRREPAPEGENPLGITSLHMHNLLMVLWLCGCSSFLLSIQHGYKSHKSQW